MLSDSIILHITFDQGQIMILGPGPDPAAREADFVLHFSSYVGLEL